MANEKKNKWVAAFLNLMVPGLGYLYIGSKRSEFAVFLVLGSLFSYVGYYTNLQVQTAFTDPSIMIGSLLVGIAFAWDAYKDAQ